MWDIGYQWEINVGIDMKYGISIRNKECGISIWSLSIWSSRTSIETTASIWSSSISTWDISSPCLSSLSFRRCRFLGLPRPSLPSATLPLLQMPREFRLLPSSSGTYQVRFHLNFSSFQASLRVTSVASPYKAKRDEPIVEMA